MYSTCQVLEWTGLERALAPGLAHQVVQRGVRGLQAGARDEGARARAGGHGAGGGAREPRRLQPREPRAAGEARQGPGRDHRARRQGHQFA